MKKLFGISLLSACLVIGSAFTNKENDTFKNYVPPGTIQLEGTSLFVDRNEITNADWAEYLVDLKNKGFLNEYQEAKPDTMSWFSVYSGEQDSFRGEFANYPVVGLSKEQIIKYCSWRSERVNELNSDYKVNYRLPTTDEWEMLTNMVKQESVKERIYAYSLKNSKKIMGVYDNVAEVISDDNFVAAGFNKAKGQNLIYRDETPSSYIGFRCVAEVTQM